MLEQIITSALVIICYLVFAGLFQTLMNAGLVLVCVKMVVASTLKEVLPANVSVVTCPLPIKYA